MKVSASSRLMLTGYSQGGYVALATQRAMQAQGGFALAAVAGMSGPYALLQFTDDIFSGAPREGASAFVPMAITAGQRAGAGLYTNTAELYEAPYAGLIETLLPNALSQAELALTVKLPGQALFARDSLPQAAGFGAYFGDGNLIRSSYRSAVLDDIKAHPCGANPAAPLDCAPAHPLRKLFQKNDLRNFAPAAPLMLCGGKGDPTVPFQNTQLAAAYFSARGAAPLVVDIDSTPASGDPYRSAKLNFLAARTAVQLDAIKKGESAQAAVDSNYHAGLVAPFCLSAARDFFSAALAR